MTTDNNSQISGSGFAFKTSLMPFLLESPLPPRISTKWDIAFSLSLTRLYRLNFVQCLFLSADCDDLLYWLSDQVFAVSDKHSHKSLLTSSQCTFPQSDHPYSLTIYRITISYLLTSITELCSKHWIVINMERDWPGWGGGCCSI